jgi:hypothetical protein
MSTNLRNTIIELSGTQEKEVIEILYRESMSYMLSQIEPYFDKNYPCSTVLRTLFIEGLKKSIVYNNIS